MCFRQWKCRRIIALLSRCFFYDGAGGLKPKWGWHLGISDSGYRQMPCLSPLQSSRDGQPNVTRGDKRISSTVNAKYNAPKVIKTKTSDHTSNHTHPSETRKYPVIRNRLFATPIWVMCYQRARCAFRSRAQHHGRYSKHWVLTKFDHGNNSAKRRS